MSDLTILNGGEYRITKERNMRKRMTSRVAEATDVLMAVDALEKSVKSADDATLTQEADGIAKEETQEVTESVPAGKANLKDNGGQNAKANKNWPTSEADKKKVASKLIALAKELLS